MLLPSITWAAMLRKLYEMDPLLCPKCGGTMEVIAFLTEHAVVDRIIDHLGLTFVAEKLLRSHCIEPVALIAAKQGAEYF